MDAGDWLSYELIDNSVLTWVTSAGTVAAVWAVLALARRILAKRLRAFAQRSNYSAVYIVDRVVARTQPWLPLLVALFVGSRVVVTPAAIDALIRIAFTIGMLLQVGLWSTAALEAWLTVRRRRQLAQSPGEVAATDLLRIVLAGAVWTVIVLMILDNLGVNVTTLVAGLGIGGVAVALAAQNVLSDLLASLAIVLDRPFRVGDSVAVDDFTGSVEGIGLKTTRLRSLSGEQLIFSNTDLLTSRVRNFGRMQQRRVAFSIGLTYRTPPSDVRRVPDIVRAAISGENHIRFERAHFSRYGDFGLMFDVVYHVLSPDFSLHADIQHRINLAIYERFAAEGIELAYPTQTLYVSALAADSPMPLAAKLAKRQRSSQPAFAPPPRDAQPPDPGTHAAQDV